MRVVIPFNLFCNTNWHHSIPLNPYYQGDNGYDFICSQDGDQGMTRCTELPMFVQNGYKCTAMAPGDPANPPSSIKTANTINPPLTVQPSQMISQNTIFPSALNTSFYFSQASHSPSSLASTTSPPFTPAPSIQLPSPTIYSLPSPFSPVSFSNSCVNWNLYYTQCLPTGPNPFKGAISFDNIGLAWVAIFQVIIFLGFCIFGLWTHNMHMNYHMYLYFYKRLIY